MTDYNWDKSESIISTSYTCGYCGNPLASERGWIGRGPGGGAAAYIYICHHCKCPTFFDNNWDQYPSVTFGSPVEDIPNESLHKLYGEARLATSVNSYTAAVLCCRKLLMHIAVSKGAEEGRSFVSYVQYLSDNHYIPPDAKEWVDHIRKKGNEANHEISIMNKDDAEILISFVEMLLKVIYEFPAAIKKRTGPKGEQAT